MVAQLGFGGGDDDGNDGNDGHQNDGDDLYDAREYGMEAEDDEAPSRYPPAFLFGRAVAGVLNFLFLFPFCVTAASPRRSPAPSGNTTMMATTSPRSKHRARNPRGS